MMHDDDRESCSADQQAWIEVARAVRGQLRKYAELMPAMTVPEAREFVATIRDALLLERDATSFDKDVELAESRVSYSD